MLMVTFVADARTDAAVPEICRIFFQSIEMRMVPGWIDGGCMVNRRERRQVFIYERWGSAAALDAWESSPSRQAILQQVNSLIERPLMSTVYTDL
jgi:antibiotic biosynthesis monooxygenase (ABM) superfamily enzyme